MLPDNILQHMNISCSFWAYRDEILSEVVPAPKTGRIKGVPPSRIYVGVLKAVPLMFDRWYFENNLSVMSRNCCAHNPAHGYMVRTNIFCRMRRLYWSCLQHYEILWCTCYWNQCKNQHFYSKIGDGLIFG